jgi:hypothetical protein
MMYIGGNGQGFFQNIDQQTKEWLHEAFGNRPFCVNFPGGAESNIATPNPLLKGWGLTEEIIRKRFSGDATDEDGNGLDKWLQKLQQQNSYGRSFLYDLQDLKNEFPNMEVIWKANIVTGGLEDAKMAFNLVRSFTGCNRVVLGNEVYSPANFAFNFDAFLEKAEGFITWLKLSYPNIHISIPIAPTPERAEHKKWNDAVKAYLETGNCNAIDIHIYLTSADLPESFGCYPIQRILYSPTEEYTELEDCFEVFANETGGETKMYLTVDYLYEHFPSYEWWMTEFNIKPSSYFSNTVSGAAYLFDTFMSMNHYFEILCVHNLVSPDVYGVICRSDKLDYDDTKNTRRCGYWALKLASEAIELGARVTYNGTVDISRFGDVFYFNGVYDPRISIPFLAQSGKVIKSYEIHAFGGEHGYDSIGRCGYISNQSEPYDPFANITVLSKEYPNYNQQAFEYDLYNGFGYIIFTTADKPKPVIKCRKWWFQFWLPKCDKARNFVIA